MKSSVNPADVTVSKVEPGWSVDGASDLGRVPRGGDGGGVFDSHAEGGLFGGGVAGTGARFGVVAGFVAPVTSGPLDGGGDWGVVSTGVFCG